MKNDIYSDMSEKDWKKLQKEGRLAGLTLAGAGALTYGANRYAGEEAMGKAYKVTKRAGKGAMLTGLGAAGLLEYAHYKRRKKAKENDSKKKD